MPSKTHISVMKLMEVTRMMILKHHSSHAVTLGSYPNFTPMFFLSMFYTI